MKEVFLRCSCGEWMSTNDPYMVDAWNEWHADGAFLAGKYHRAATYPSAQSQSQVKE